MPSCRLIGVTTLGAAFAAGVILLPHYPPTCGS
jgi:hypothetical protein